MPDHKLIKMNADGTSSEEDFPAEWAGDDPEKKARLKEIVGSEIEYVFVLHKGKRTAMIVNEMGAILTPPLPINKKATKIYWRASVMRHLNLSEDEYEAMFDVLWGNPDMNYIHGDVALLEGVTIL